MLQCQMLQQSAVEKSGRNLTTLSVRSEQPNKQLAASDALHFVQHEPMLYALEVRRDDSLGLEVIDSQSTTCVPTSARILVFGRVGCGS